MLQFKLWHLCAVIAAVAAVLGFGRLAWQDPEWLVLPALMLLPFLICMLVLILKDTLVNLWSESCPGSPTRNARLATNALSAAKFTCYFWVGYVLLLFAVTLLHLTL
jgi:hypothetical protein